MELLLSNYKKENKYAGYNHSTQNTCVTTSLISVGGCAAQCRKIDYRKSESYILSEKNYDERQLE